MNGKEKELKEKKWEYPRYLTHAPPGYLKYILWIIITSLQHTGD